ncbi:MAG: hypothetical protein ACI8WB_003460 [Phenylobacterium sp.]|jgi:hypothetical protein
MSRQYATLCGITQQELEDHFGQVIDELTNQQSLDKSQMLAKIKHWYNGYFFEENAVSVYNPYSLLGLFVDQTFKNYWFAEEIADDPDFPVVSPVGVPASTSGGQKLRALASGPLRPSFLMTLLKSKDYDLKNLTQF